MTTTYDPDNRVQPEAEIAEDFCDVHVRRIGDGTVFVKPSKLDGDGEFPLTVANIGLALRILGFNRDDVLPDDGR